MTLTEHALQSMGFQEIDPEVPFTAHFYHISVAEVVGLTVDRGTIIRREVKHDFELPVTVLLGNSLNEMCRDELDDDFISNEEEWCKEQGVNPPFLIIVVGPTEKHTATKGRWKEGEDSEVVTYETFESAKSTLRSVAERAAPRIYSSVTVQFYHLQNTLRIKPIKPTIAGKLDDGRIIHDIRVQMSGSVTVYTSINTSEIEQLLSDSIDRLPNLDTRATGFLYSAEVEKDRIRRFLNYFVSVEIATHRAFKSTDESSTEILSSALPSQIRAEGGALIERIYSEFRSLVDRFVWCSVVCWPNMTDHEIAELRRLKKIRDDIAHGKVGDVAQTDVEAMRSLALTVLRA